MENEYYIIERLNNIPFKIKRLKLFKTKDNRIFSVDIKVKKEKKEKKEKMTIDHKKITGFYVLSISGNEKKASKWLGGGQNYKGILTEINDDNIKEYYHDKYKIIEIIDIWKRWHLNDLQPNCKHQKSFDCNVSNFEELADKQTKKCPQGYKYGSAWLVEPLPVDIIQQLLKLTN